MEIIRQFCSSTEEAYTASSFRTLSSAIPGVCFHDVFLVSGCRVTWFVVCNVDILHGKSECNKIITF